MMMVVVIKGLGWGITVERSNDVHAARGQGSPVTAARTPRLASHQREEIRKGNEQKRKSQTIS